MLPRRIKATLILGLCSSGIANRRQGVPIPTSANNSIAFLRLVLAALVLFSHSYDLGGFGIEPLRVFSHGDQSFGSLAVAGFFFLSGFLITQSYRKSHSIWRFLWHRILRIFPGFWMCLMITAFIFAPLVCLLERGSLAHYIRGGTNGPFHYVMANGLLEMQQYDIAGLLARNPYPSAFDGSLWSLHNEFVCYLAVGILGVFGIITRRRTLLLGLTVCAWMVAAAPHIVQVVPPLALLLVLFGRGPVFDPIVYFFVGALCFLFHDKIVLHWGLFLLAVLLIPMTLATGWSAFVLPVAGPYVLLWLAFRLPIRHFDRHGDVSYGVYIYAFPIQQILAAFGMHRCGLPLYLSLTLALTLSLATLSWHLVEQPCLRLKKISCPSLTAIRFGWAGSE